jgi:hypothetical protein
MVNIIADFVLSTVSGLMSIFPKQPSITGHLLLRATLVVWAVMGDLLTMELLRLRI